MFFALSAVLEERLVGFTFLSSPVMNRLPCHHSCQGVISFHHIRIHNPAITGNVSLNPAVLKASHTAICRFPDFLYYKSIYCRDSLKRKGKTFGKTREFLFFHFCGHHVRFLFPISKTLRKKHLFWKN